MTSALWLLIETVGSLLATACMLRAYALRVHLPPRNPVTQFVVAITDWLVRPLQRLMPPSRNNDWASLLGAILLAVVTAVIWSLIFMRGRAPAPGAVLILAAFWLVKWALYLLNALVILQAILSWVNPYAPMAPAIAQLTAPFLAPIRRIIKPVGGVDLSPLVLVLAVMVALQLLQTLFMQIGSLPF